MDPDIALLERWRAGDKRAGEELFGRHFADIFRFFDGKVAGRPEDLAQQTFLQCLKSQDGCRAESSFRTYLFAIAWNEFRQHLRRETKNESVDFEASSLDELAGSRQREQMQQALARLPVAQQILLECFFWHHLNTAALAEIFAMPPKAIRQRLATALEALQAERKRLSPAALAPDAADPLTTALLELEAKDQLESD